MGAVAGQLTAAREGLRPVGADVLEAAAARLCDNSEAGTAYGRSNGAVQTSQRTGFRLARGHMCTIARQAAGILLQLHGTSISSLSIWTSISSVITTGYVHVDGGAVVEGLAPAESAALARRTAALAFAPQSLAATEQRVRA